MKNLDIKTLHRKLTDPTLFSLVNSWLNTKAQADHLRGEVDRIQRRVLAEVELLQSTNSHLDGDGSRITDPRFVYLCEDEDACQRYYDRVEEEEEKAGLRTGLPKDYCPALYAERNLSYISHAIADLVGPILGFDKHELFLQGDGVKTWEKFIGLVVSAVINHPAFEPHNMYEEALRDQEGEQHA
jgi:hypothetical protein